MNVYALKNHIIDNPDLIGLILEKSGFHSIDDSFNQGSETRCAREEGKNPTAIRVLHDTLYTTCFSTNLKGDLITLVQDKLQVTFPKVIKVISEIINFKDVEVKPYRLPFSGYYKKIMKLDGEEPHEIQTYPESILNQFEIIPNKMFLDDGISTDVQLKYKIGYDFLTNRIVVPWRNTSGELCGVMGRLNQRKVSENENKWFPVLPFPKSKTLFGFGENYNSIQEHEICMIGESEKHVLQLESMGINVGLALGGSNLSQMQSNFIKSLFPKKIIIMMDQGLSEEHSREIATQLKMNSYYKNDVGYVYDKQGIYLPEKYAPSDLDKGRLNKLIKECAVWI